MTNKDIFTKNIIKGASGYGMPKDKFRECLEQIPHELFDEFVYTLYRCADKNEAWYFESQELVD